MEDQGAPGLLEPHRANAFQFPTTYSTCKVADLWINSKMNELIRFFRVEEIQIVPILTFPSQKRPLKYLAEMGIDIQHDY